MLLIKLIANIFSNKLKLVWWRDSIRVLFTDILLHKSN